MESKFLELEARRKIYEYIAKYPGLHFRELQRRTQMATGSLDYHLHFLHRNGMIRTERAGRLVLYYPTNVSYDSSDKEILGLLKHSTTRHILIYMIEKKMCNAKNISGTLKMSPSNLSWYLKMLEEKNIIVHKKKGRFRFYSVVSKERIIKCLLSYKASFMDNLVDRFIEAWELEE